MLDLLRARPLVLGAFALAGCFIDGGAPPASDDTGPVATTSSSGPPDKSSSGDAPTTTTGDATTTAGATTDGATTRAPASCDAPDACEPGDTQLSAEDCDPCGQPQRTCQDDCTWSAETCVPSVDACAYWVFGGAQSKRPGWRAVKRAELASEDAPTAPVIAAFDLSLHNKVVAVTATTYHALNPNTGEWTQSGPLLFLMPELPGAIEQTYAVWDGAEERYALTVGSGDSAYIYLVEPITLFGEPLSFTDCCGDFNPPNSPPSLGVVRDIYVDLANAEGWAQGSPMALCGGQAPTALGGYAAWVAPDTVYVQDAGYCFNFFPPVDYSRFHPFAQPGAPPGALVGGAALIGGELHVFAGE